MNIARILYPIEVLGPGKRIGIWFCGCEHHCKGCSNPELWKQESRYEVDIDTVMELIDSVATNYKIDGFTLTGGDPFYQPHALEMLLPKLQEYSKDILCYSGYEEEYLKETYPEIVNQLSVLIDGRYIDERNNGIFLRGSDNQRVIVINDDFSELYDEYIKDGHNRIQNFRTKDTVISVGIHSKDYERELNDILGSKGLTKSV